MGLTAIGCYPSYTYIIASFEKKSSQKCRFFNFLNVLILVPVIAIL